ncbi:MAG TPA: tetratricopeptide repeat protein [Bryobacteraceae bacterium]|nr:tetratricopeptide repeat protein [Bryobacteraceae bacterium]
MLARTGMVVLIAAGALAAADKPSQEILELQRDVAQLQEMVKTLGQSMEQRAAAMNGAIQGIAASVEKVNASVAALQKGIGDVAPTIATQGVRIDQAGQSLNQVQQAVADLTAAVNKLQTQVGDIGNAVKAMAAPPAGPPGTEKPPVGAADLFNNATGDQSGGKPELALQEFTDYIKYYGDTPMAHVAQFQIGVLHYQLKQYDLALADFDTLEQKFPNSTKLADALYYKNKSLQGLGRSADAAAACQELRKKFPTSELASKCVTVRH